MEFTNASLSSPLQDGRNVVEHFLLGKNVIGTPQYLQTIGYTVVAFETHLDAGASKLSECFSQPFHFLPRFTRERVEFLSMMRHRHCTTLSKRLRNCQ
jgi:hypothetical protein